MIGMEWLKDFRMGWLKDLGWDPRTMSPKNHVPCHPQTNLTLCQDIIATCLEILPRPHQGQKREEG